MIGFALKKFASQNGMLTSHGVAYGSLRGYSATLSEGSGYKQIVFTTSFSDAALEKAFWDEVNAAPLQKSYRVQSINVAGKNVQIVFADNPGTMKKLEKFVDWFVSLLKKYEAARVSVCPECGMPVNGGCWKLVNGVAYHVHESCGENMRNRVDAENENRKMAAEGSYGMGLIGALLGSVVGAIVWAVVLCMGYVASLVGLLIGWLSEKGYNLLRGKQGKAKVAILIVAIIVGVVVGTLGGYALSFVQLIAEDEAATLTYSDIPMLMEYTLTDPETQGYVWKDVILGLLFAGLGVFALLRKTGKAVADASFADLE